MRATYWVLVATIVSLFGYIAYDELSPWRLRPYGNVEIVAIERNGSNVLFRANFDKFRCKFESLRPVSIELGEVRPLTYEDAQGRGQNDNREAGSQTLDIVIDLEDTNPDRVELRTRHLCVNNGEEVLDTRVFAAFDPRRLIPVK